MTSTLVTRVEDLVEVTPSRDARREATRLVAQLVTMRDVHMAIGNPFPMWVKAHDAAGGLRAVIRVVDESEAYVALAKLGTLHPGRVSLRPGRREPTTVRRAAVAPPRLAVTA